MDTMFTRFELWCDDNEAPLLATDDIDELIRYLYAHKIGLDPRHYIKEATIQ